MLRSPVDNMHENFHNCVQIKLFNVHYSPIRINSSFLSNIFDSFECIVQIFDLQATRGKKPSADAMIFTREAEQISLVLLQDSLTDNICSE